MKIESPCVGVCELKDNVCIGCNRTIEEITNWVPISQKKELKNALRK